MSNSKIEQKEDLIENCTSNQAGRRKAIKLIATGVTAIAAYNILPTTWNKPIIEQVFLPAHAATSGETDTSETETETSPAASSCGEPCSEISVTNHVDSDTEIHMHYHLCPDDTADTILTVDVGAMEVIVVNPGTEIRVHSDDDNISSTVSNLLGAAESVRNNGPQEAYVTLDACGGSGSFTALLETIPVP